MLWILIRIAPHRGDFNSTHNICFDGEPTKIILELSSNTLIICSTVGVHVLQTLCSNTEGIFMTLTFDQCLCHGRPHTALCGAVFNGSLIIFNEDVEEEPQSYITPCSYHLCEYKMPHTHNIVGITPRASANFQNQEVQDFQPFKFGSEANETWTMEHQKISIFSGFKRSYK